MSVLYDKLHADLEKHAAHTMDTPYLYNGSVGSICIDGRCNVAQLKALIEYLENGGGEEDV